MSRERTVSCASSPAPYPSRAPSPSHSISCSPYHSCVHSFSITFHVDNSSASYLDLNSSGTSTDGFPSARILASRLGFSSICVREGRET